MRTTAEVGAGLLGLAVVAFFAWASLDRAPKLAQAPVASQEEEATPPVTPATSPSAPSPPIAETPTVQRTPEASASPATVVETKRLSLAHEQAEDERVGDLQDQHAITPAVDEKLYYKVRVRDGGTLEAGKITIRLDGVDARQADGKCTDENGKDWACGAEARLALAKLIRYRAIKCALPPGGETSEFVSRCSVGGVDLSVWMVRQGWAKPKDGGGKDFAEALEAAKVDHAGLWRTQVESDAQTTGSQ
jgi:endonuclease YncB( thermonuclease family)